MTDGIAGALVGLYDAIVALDLEINAAETEAVTTNLHVARELVAALNRARPFVEEHR